MNHAVVGENCIIGANSLITERKEFANSLIMGSPAKVYELSEDEIKFLKLSAEFYMKNKKYRDELKHEVK